MHSFITVSKNKKSALDYMIEACKKNQIDKFDVNILTFPKAIGIEDIRNFQRQLYLKPIKSKTKAIILDVYNGVTIQAQNALLKVLEEPPANTIIYIAIQNKNLLLPTVLSRCKIIELNEKSSELSQQESAQHLNILISLPEKSVGDKLKLAQDLAKNKDDVIPWLERMIIVARKELIENVKNKNDPLLISQYLNILISFQKTYTFLKTTNVSARLTLENLFLKAGSF